MIRPAVPDDAYTLARMRHEMWDEMDPDRPAGPDYRERLFVYWYETIAAGTTLAWLAEVDGQPVGMVALLLHFHPPLPTTERRRGYVTAVYVVPAHRRQGLGRALMEQVIAYGREHGIQRLELRTSPMARPLYEALGFRAHELLMFDTGG